MYNEKIETHVIIAAGVLQQLKKCEFGLKRESLVFWILHEGKTNSFRFCNTS